MKVSEDLQRFADSWATHHLSMKFFVQDKTDRELADLRIHCLDATQTNCWFAVYEAAKDLRRAAEVEMRSRHEGVLNGNRPITLDNALNLFGNRVEVLDSGQFGVIDRVGWKRIGVLLPYGRTVRTSPKNLRIAERRKPVV